MAGKEAGLANRSHSPDHSKLSNNKSGHLGNDVHSHARKRHHSPHSHSHGYHGHSPHMEDIQKAELQARQEEGSNVNGECVRACMCVCVRERERERVHEFV